MINLKGLHMNYQLLESIGLVGFDLSYVLIGIVALLLILIILVIVLIIKLNKLSKLYGKFMTGKDGQSLEQEIIGLVDDNNLMKDTIDKNKKNIRDLYKQFENAFQKVGLVRYDAFNQMGGKLSYSIALLDQNNNGFIINSVHGADGCYSYTKEIKNGSCNISLGDEEQQALNEAMNVD